MIRLSRWFRGEGVKDLSFHRLFMGATGGRSSREHARDRDTRGVEMFCCTAVVFEQSPPLARVLHRLGRCGGQSFFCCCCKWLCETLGDLRLMLCPSCGSHAPSVCFFVAWVQLPFKSHLGFRGVLLGTCGEAGGIRMHNHCLCFCCACVVFFSCPREERARAICRMREHRRCHLCSVIY